MRSHTKEENMLRRLTVVVALIVIVAIAQAAAPPPAGTIRDAVLLSRNGDHEASEAILSKIHPRDRTSEYDFYRMINNFCLNKKLEAEKFAAHLEYGFGKDVPQRYKDMAVIIRADASTWKKDPKDL